MDDGVPPDPPGLPPAEVSVDAAVVRALLRDQHPDLAGRPLRWEATGWDNVTFRLGDDLAVRLPRVTSAVDPIRHEQRWLPVLAPDLPVAVPAPVRTGTPGAGYPWPWSVVPWFTGRTAAEEVPAESQAARFGRFLAAVHRPAPDEAPRNTYRGVPLAAVEDRVRARLDGVTHGDALPVPPDQLRRRWDAAAAAPADSPETWVHGDLHPKNVVVDGGSLAAIIDWGDMTVGDRATDLGAAWMLFPVRVHADIWAACGPLTAATMRRAEGWAIFFGVTLLGVGLAGDAAFAEIGARTLRRVVAGSPEPP